MAATKKAAKKRPAKKAATKTAKKATAKKATTKTTNTDVTFTDDIPKVTREGGGNRGSKYDDLLDKLVERHENGKSSTARMVFDTVGQSTSRYQSIKGAIEKRDDSHLFDVAQRTEGEERAVYVKFDPDAEEPEDEEPEAEEVGEEETEEEEDDLEFEEDDDLDF